MMSILYPNAPDTSLATMDHFDVQTEGDDLSRHSNYLNTLQHYFATFFSSEPVRGGESIVVTVGTRSVDIAAAHNMDIHSESNYQWFISSVEVRIVP